MEKILIFVELGKVNSKYKLIFIKELFKINSQSLRTFQLTGAWNSYTVFSGLMMKVNVSGDLRANRNS